MSLETVRRILHLQSKPRYERYEGEKGRKIFDEGNPEFEKALQYVIRESVRLNSLLELTHYQIAMWEELSKALEPGRWVNKPKSPGKRYINGKAYAELSITDEHIGDNPEIIKVITATALRNVNGRTLDAFSIEAQHVNGSFIGAMQFVITKGKAGPRNFHDFFAVNPPSTIEMTADGAINSIFRSFSNDYVNMYSPIGRMPGSSNQQLYGANKNQTFRDQFL